MSDVKEMLDAAMVAWHAADVDTWLDQFTTDAKFFVPGRTPISGDHDRESIRPVALLLMRANGQESGLWVIESFLSGTGAIALADQKVDRDGTTHHYHQVLVHETAPSEPSRFAFWWLMIHEYEAFELAWA